MSLGPKMSLSGEKPHVRPYSRSSLATSTQTKLGFARQLASRPGAVRSVDGSSPMTLPCQVRCHPRHLRPAFPSSPQPSQSHPPPSLSPPRSAFPSPPQPYMSPPWSSPLYVLPAGGIVCAFPLHHCRMLVP